MTGNLSGYGWGVGQNFLKGGPEAGLGLLHDRQDMVAVSDAWIAKLAEVGVKLLPILDGNTALDPNVYAAYCERQMRRVCLDSPGGLHPALQGKRDLQADAVELMNEPYWLSSRGNAAQATAGYARCVKAAYQRCKPLFPNVHFIAALEVQNKTEASPNWVDGCYAAVPDFHNYFDGWSCHNYGPVEAIKNNVAADRWRANRWRYIRDWLNSRSGAGNRPISFTETGATQGPGQEGWYRSFIDALFGEWKDFPIWEVSFHHALDYGTSSTSAQGITANGQLGTARPAFFQVKNRLGGRNQAPHRVGHEFWKAGSTPTPPSPPPPPTAGGWGLKAEPGIRAVTLSWNGPGDFKLAMTPENGGTTYRQVGTVTRFVWMNLEPGVYFADVEHDGKGDWAGRVKVTVNATPPPNPTLPALKAGDKVTINYGVYKGKKATLREPGWSLMIDGQTESRMYLTKRLDRP